jgi:DNA/RNA-binding domain of Phe-tRNA-synthetase-like protein
VRFHHRAEIWRDFPDLVPAVLYVEGVTPDADVADAVAEQTATARDRLDKAAEGQFPEVQAWRRAYAALGLKPTQYRCASESLLRRLRREGELPRLHPLVDLCNAVSMAYAVPVAALDLACVAGDLAVGYADGTEMYETFGGELEHPEQGEVIFVDGANNAHARRWTNRQSGRSAIRPSTTTALIVAEGLHATAPEDLPRLVETLAGAWPAKPVTAVLTRDAPVFVTP